MSDPTAHRLRRAVVIDDDDDIRELHGQIMTQSGFQPFLASNAVDGLAMVRELDPIVTIVDVSMPGMDGFAAARLIREFSDTYILMVSALSDEIDIIEGLSAGADDYLRKPFRPRELRARVEALLRRPRGFTELAGEPSPPAPAPAAVEPEVTKAAVLVDPVVHTPTGHDEDPVEVVVADTGGDQDEEVVRCGSLALNTTRQEVKVDGTEIGLNPSEYAPLAALVDSGSRVLSTTNLLLCLRNEGYVTDYQIDENDQRTVRAHMSNLLRKLGDTGVTPKWVENVRGVGYRMCM